MDKEHSSRIGSQSKSRLVAKLPSFRSEMTIHISKTPSYSGNSIVLNRATSTASSSSSTPSPSGEFQIQNQRRFPSGGSDRSKKPSLSKFRFVPGSNLYGNHYQHDYQQQQHPDSASPGHHNNLIISTPFVERCMRDFARSSSSEPHSASFLYPKRHVQACKLDVSEPPSDKSQDDSCLTSSVKPGLRHDEKTKSTDHLLEEKTTQRRNESFKSSEKRHSFCAIESESCKEESNVRSKPSTGESTLKAGISTLSISKPNWFFKKYVERQESKLAPRKYASCRDLGGVDCEGWLWKRHEKSGMKRVKWIQWWCVLENKALKFFKEKESCSSEGSIYLPGMKVAPAPELNHKKGAFKVFHAGSTFYFRVNKQEDMIRWMNKMSLATLSNFEVQSSKMIAGFQNEEESALNAQRSSESEENLSSNCSSPSLSREDLNRISRSSDNLQNVKKSSQIVQQHQLRNKFSSLKKLLKEKEEQLSAIVTFLGNHEITGEDLYRFMESHSAMTDQDNSKFYSKPNLIITSPLMSRQLTSGQFL